ncbi:hypothetical protein EYC84_004100 [Monilinia fructicola]|uniref:Uncharacterized protein n=1 Tax=Monilinia fructicola TaxID=38448 RepID=A0A5M9K3V7_MONFR|nr:hypothetical protein EYC84_004100 [Monilinia fructicola]
MFTLQHHVTLSYYPSSHSVHPINTLTTTHLPASNTFSKPYPKLLKRRYVIKAQQTQASPQSASVQYKPTS